MRSIGALFGLGGLPAATRRGLAIAFSASVTVIMGVNLVYPVLPPMVQQLGVDQAAIGLVITVHVLPTIFLAPVVGALADLYGRRLLVFWGMLLFGLAGAGVALAPDFGWVLALRLLQGVGASALLPLTVVLLSDLVEGEQESSAQGMKVVLDRTATSVLPALAGLLAALAWNLPFLLYALAVPLAFLGLAWLPETRTGEREGLRAYLGGFRCLGQRPRLLVAFSAGSLRFFLDYGYFTYLPIYLVLTRGASPAVAGLLFAFYGAGAMATASQAGRLVRGRDPARLLFVGFALAGISVLAIPFLPSELLVGASLFVYGLGNGIISPLQKLVLTRNAPPEVRGGVVALDQVVQQLAKSLAPGAMGALLLAADVTAVFWTLGALSLGSVVLAAILLAARGRRAASMGSRSGVAVRNEIRSDSARTGQLLLPAVQAELRHTLEISEVASQQDQVVVNSSGSDEDVHVADGSPFAS
ncbi:MAG: MFS transporter [Chloroflexi bacterium]|nr:MFS transporter [Chloroflexota bacterium]